MAWRPHARVRASARNPRAAAICDRCGIPTNHYKLRWQYDWTGAQLQNLRILVCQPCLDEPQEQLRAKILSSDPLPIWNARPEPFTYTSFSYDESNIMCMPTFSGGDFNVDYNSDESDFQSFPPGLDGDGAQMLQPDGKTVLLMPNNPSLSLNVQGGDYDDDYNQNYSGGV